MVVSLNVKLRTTNSSTSERGALQKFPEKRKSMREM